MNHMKHFFLLHSIIVAALHMVRTSEAGFDNFERESYAFSLKAMVCKRYRSGELTDDQRDRLYALIETIYD